MATITFAHTTYQITRVCIVRLDKDRQIPTVRICATELGTNYPANLQWRANVYFDRKHNPDARNARGELDARFIDVWYFNAWNVHSPLNNPAQVAMIDRAVDEYVAEIADDLAHPPIARTPVAGVAKTTDIDAAFAACTTEAEVDAVLARIDRTDENEARLAYITAVYDAALTRVQRAPVAPTEAQIAATVHPYRATVIDRAIGKNIKITDADVNASNTLREVALDYVLTYTGTNGFVQDIAVRLQDYGHLSPAQMRGALNVMVAEARSERAARAAEASMQLSKADALAFDARHNGGAPNSAIQEYYLDLRSKKDVEADDAGAAPDIDTQALTRRTPNGTYTIILNEATDEYRTLRLIDAPDHFNSKPGTQIAQYLSGADNETSFTSFAFVTGDFSTVWKKFRTTVDSKIVRALETLVNSDDPMVHMREYVLRSSHCGVCGRKLSTPDSIRAGIGPICAGKLAEMGYTFELTPADRKRNAQKADVLAGTPTITRAQAQADIDELFD